MRVQRLTAAAALLAASLLAAPAEVAPGSVVRWGAPGVTVCRFEGRTWAPLGEVCFFPVDLLATGTLTFERTRNGRIERVQRRVGRYPYPEQRLRVPERMVNLSPEDLARVERENARIALLWPRESEVRFTLPLAPPLPPSFRGERFGHRRVFNGQPRSPHNGLDFKAPAGTPVTAPADGVVVLAEEHFFAGNSVFVDHGGGLISMCFHLADLPVREGQEVRRGEVLGHVGSTGRATGPHLHFGLRWHGARIDPGLLFGPPERLPSLDP
ncbi:MAG TPA: M23 family metallopeptidase [Thermoanaerobaculaceae bacterium]|nr:M23 family metallopeptidase [Thermoanaerobaculaceae bacterium]HRS16883.1 M23 family metallopeptidase [Thermoanaerobaculaceae bacterium]